MQDYDDTPSPLTGLFVQVEDPETGAVRRRVIEPHMHRLRDVLQKHGLTWADVDTWGFYSEAGWPVHRGADAQAHAKAMGLAAATPLAPADVWPDGDRVPDDETSTSAD